MSKFVAYHQPAELRYRKTSGGVPWDDRSGAEQIRILTSQYERALIDLPTLEQKLEVAVAKEASESSLASDLARLPRPFPTGACDAIIIRK